MQQSAFINPVTLPSPENLNAAEQKFVQRMAEGRGCEIKEGESTKVIRADVIRFFAWGGDKDDSIRGNIIDLQGAHVSGTLNLENVPSGYALALTKCHFDSPVKMIYSRFRSVNLDNSHLMGGLIGSGMQIDRDIFMNNTLVAKGGVNLIDADISGNLFCSGSQFVNKEGFALIADRLKLGGNLHMKKNFSAEGGVRLSGAKIGGELNCEGSSFNNAVGYAFVAEGIRVAGSVTMNGGFSVEGGASLISATIGGGLNLSGGVFNNKKGYALVASGVKVGGGFVMKNDDNVHFCADGGVYLVAADIAGDLICRGKFVKNTEGCALIADGVKVGGCLRTDCYAGGSFYADGEVSLVAAHIGINWTCKGAEFNGHVSAESAEIVNSVFWQNVSGKGECILSFAAANIFDYDEKSLCGFEFVLDGFSYKEFAERKSFEFRLNWLRSRPARKDFAPQPFEQAAKVLFAMGQNNDAREILLKKEELLTKHDKKMPLWNKFWRILWYGFAGYGYRLKWTAWWMVFFIVFGAGLFGYADSKCRIVPHQPVVMTLDKYTPLWDGEKCATINRPTEVMAQAYPDYPRFGAIVYSLDVFIPYFSLHKETHWYPQPKEDDADLALVILRLWYWIEIIAGWMLTSLLVLTITGLLKPRQSSLE